MKLVGDCNQLNPIFVWLENYIIRLKFGIYLINPGIGIPNPDFSSEFNAFDLHCV